MSDAARTVLIVLAVILIAVVLVPLLFMGGMMNTMMGGVPLGMGGIVGVVLLAAAALLVVGVRR